MLPKYAESASRFPINGILCRYFPPAWREPAD